MVIILINKIIFIDDWILPKSYTSKFKCTHYADALPAGMLVAAPAETTRADMFLCAALASLATLATISFRSVHGYKYY
jgi:hypothetical protein